MYHLRLSIELIAESENGFPVALPFAAASARKAVVSQETEVAESTVQLASLDAFIKQLQGRLDEAESHFSRGRVSAARTSSRNPGRTNA